MTPSADNAPQPGNQLRRGRGWQSDEVGVCGQPQVVERIRSWFVDYGIVCTAVDSPGVLSLAGRDGMMGWIRAGSEVELPNSLRGSAWCLTVDRARDPADPLQFLWPDEAQALMCTVIALRDESSERPVVDVSIEERVKHAFRSGSVPIPDDISVHVEDGVVTLGGSTTSPWLVDEIRALALRVPGVRAVRIAALDLHADEWVESPLDSTDEHSENPVIDDWPTLVAARAHGWPAQVEALEAALRVNRPRTRQRGVRLNGLVTQVVANWPAYMWARAKLASKLERREPRLAADLAIIRSRVQELRIRLGLLSGQLERLARAEAKSEAARHAALSRLELELARWLAGFRTADDSFSSLVVQARHTE